MTTVTQENHVMAVAELLRDKATLVLSGAGISTESGIPDYRGPNPDGTPRAVRKPMRYQEFIRSAQARQRYWARSSVGWQNIQQAKPNTGHRALATLQQQGYIQAIITQNVDGLHQAAGSSPVLELHGSLHRVVCLQCGKLEPRENLQHRLLCLNPTMYQQHAMSTSLVPDSAEGVASDIAPDGDADIAEVLEQRFAVADCLHCDGVLKPDVVFFGENVPAKRVAAAWQYYEAADVLLVIGSSLTVYSGYRFVHRAAQEEKPIIIVTDGETRGDTLATIKVQQRLGTFLPALVATMAE